jgi:4-diphosphocytidyl-2C-methyl-D-erythritol kinase
MNEITVVANAKINLGLRAKYKRNDRFGEIESIFRISYSLRNIIK